MSEQGTVLVVDDEQVILESVRDVLQLAGYRVITAEDGLEALRILDTQTPDLILADIMMPRMSGYQLYHRIRRTPEWLWIPFIFLSARAEREDIRFGKELGAEDYLTKPIDAEELIAAVSGRLERFRQLEQSGAVRKPKERRGGVYRASELEIDLSKRMVTVSGQEVRLSPTELHVLEQLTLAGGAVVAYEDLLPAEDGTLDGQDAASLTRYHIRNLRSKLKASGLQIDLITNVRETGYRLTVEPQRR
jgi:DNA-binding response OmpR family regulator